MTDLTLQEAIAELRQMELTYGQLWTAREVMQTRNADNCKTIATILTAATSGELIPRADATLAVALVVEKRFRATVKHEGEGVGDLPWLEEFWAIRADAIVPDDALAELQALRAERDAFKGNADDAYAKWVAERSRAEAAEAELAATQAKLARVVDALKGLDKAATEVSRLGAVTGSQWSRLTVASLAARAALEGATP